MSQRTAYAARRTPRAPEDRPGAGSGQIPLTRAPARGVVARARYRFDLTLSRGAGALILWLALVTTIFVAVTGALLHVVAHFTSVDGGPIAEDADNYVESMWDALMRTLDPGTVTGDETWPYRLAALAITVGGIFIFSTLIGLIASVIDRRIENLRKGRGVVVEEGHTLILGWSEKLHTIVHELQEASSNQRRSCVVVLADRDRVRMEDELNARFGGNLALDLLTGKVALGVFKELTRRGRSRTRIVCRSGNPADPADLAIASPTTARSIIVLLEDRPSADAQAIKTLLGLMSFDGGLGSMDVTFEVQDRDTAHAINQATAGRARTVVTRDLMSRVTAQICRQAGMGAVYQELFDFAGDEIYFTSPRALVGATYGAALLSFPTSSVIGIRRADGTIQLNPPTTTTLAVDDKLIAISEDDDTLTIGQIDGWRPSDSDPNPTPIQLPPDHVLLTGWNTNAHAVVEHIAKAAAPGSTLTVLADPALAAPTSAELDRFATLQVELRLGDTTRAEPLRDVLDERPFERLVLLGYHDQLDAPEADARTLLTLVHARRLLDDPRRNAGEASLVAELVDTRSVTLGKVANPDDFVVSERLTSLIIAQLAENPELQVIFDELLDAEGVEIRLQPLAAYVDPEATDVRWIDIVRAARSRSESAIGYVSPPFADEDGVWINPAKDSLVDVLRATNAIVVA